MTKDLRIVFWGTPSFAVPSLLALLEMQYEIVGVITQPDQTVGRKKEIVSPLVKIVATGNHLSVFQPPTLKDDAFFSEFSTLRPDLCVVVAYGKIIPQKYLEFPKYGFINIHPSLLPKYRGPSPVQTAIMNGDEETGVSLIKLDEQMDHGPILAVQKYMIDEEAYCPEIKNGLAEAGAQILLDVIPEIISGKIKSETQDDTKATYCKILNREDGKIDWSQPPEKIYNLIRALSDEPGTWTTWKGRVLNIKKASIKDDQLVLESVQLEGKKETPFTDFLRGYPDFKITDLK